MTASRILACYQNPKAFDFGPIQQFVLDRNHQGQANQLLFPRPAPPKCTSGGVRCQQRLGGLLKYYYQEAAEVAKPLELAGFWLAGLVCVVLAVLKLTVEAQWSWWRVSLPLWAVLGHNILYIMVGLVWLFFADDGAAEEAITIRPGDGGYGYQIAALVCFVVFADNLLRRIEGSGENMLWVSSGRWELIVVSGTLSVLMQLLFWSEVVDPGTRRTHRG